LHSWKTNPYNKTPAALFYLQVLMQTTVRRSQKYSWNTQIFHLFYMFWPAFL